MNYKTLEEAEKDLKKIWKTCVGCLIKSKEVICPVCNKPSYSYDEEYAHEPSVTRCPWCHPTEEHCYHLFKRDSKCIESVVIVCCYCGQVIYTPISNTKFDYKINGKHLIRLKKIKFEVLS